MAAADYPAFHSYPAALNFSFFKDIELMGINPAATDNQP
jgi:hypothetical protein